MMIRHFDVFIRCMPLLASAVHDAFRYRQYAV